MSGDVVHFEIPSDNIERARKFYHRTFGWKMDPMPGMNYTLVGTTESTDSGRPKSPGAINGGLLLRQPPVHVPTITIHVDDIDRAAQKITKNGGKMVEPKSPIGDGSVGFAAYFEDSEGNVIGLFERAAG
jgi:predicted enzyme related to lactoylglutathione lyase